MNLTNPGYGVLTSNGFQHLVQNGGHYSYKDDGSYEGNNPVLSDHEYYGSFDNASVSTTDSYSRWNDFDDVDTPVTHSSNHYENNHVSDDYLHASYSSIQDYPYTTETSAPEIDSIRLENVKECKGLASTTLVAWNLLNLILSTSLLGFPFIVSKCGYILLPFLLVILLMMNFTSCILVNMMYSESVGFDGRRFRIHLDYPDLTRDVLNSSRVAYFVQIMQFVEMLAICVLNICVLGQLTHEILPNVDVQLCTVIASLLAFPTFFVRRLVVIGWMQTIGVLALFIGVVLIQSYCFINVSKWNYDAIPMFNLNELPTGLGVIVYAFGIHSVLPGLEEQMKTPDKFGRTVNICFLVSLIVQCVFSITNSMFYGKDIDQVITIGLESHFALGVATACFNGLSILTHFSLPSFIVIEKLDKAVNRVFACCRLNTEHSCLDSLLKFLVRIIVMALSVSLAVFLPYFVYLMALVGSVITVTLSLILPCVLHLKLNGWTLSKFVFCLDVLIIMFGIFIFSTGSISSTYNLYVNIS